MSAANPLRNFVLRVNQYPQWLSQRLISWIFRHKVKLAGTVSLDILHTDCKSVTCRQRNLKKVQNHIGGVHAAGMALLAESATGFIVGVNLPGDKLPLLKSMQLNYTKRATGDLTAVASLTDEQIQQMQQQDKGDVTVAVTLTDSVSVEPVVCEMVWAWVPKNKR